MSEHDLKTWPEPFSAILCGEKRFEIRKADRDFRVGDRLALREWGPDTGAHTGRYLTAFVTYLVPPGKWGLPNDLCVMGIIVVGERQPWPVAAKYDARLRESPQSNRE